MHWGESTKPELIKVARSYEEYFTGHINWQKKTTGSLPQMGLILKDVAHLPAVVALDIPLSPLPIRGYREADRQITSRYGRKGAAVHSPTPERPGIIAELIFRQLTEAGMKWGSREAQPADGSYFLEVYPHVTIIEMMRLDYRLPYKSQKRRKYWKDKSSEEQYQLAVRQLQFLAEGIQEQINNNIYDYLPKLDTKESYKMHFLKAYEDVLDAIICALSGCFFLQGKAVGLGDKSSAIWVPVL
ncbi:MAG: DUF429 domain-containing protein [Cyclobacteriaceae bacterium]